MVIDTLQHIRGNEFVKNIYAGDVEFDLTILALTHTNKGKHDDDISKISGSEGMAGGTDGNWVLTKSKRTDTRANLTISNRDIEALEFDKESCRWNKLTRDESFPMQCAPITASPPATTASAISRPGQRIKHCRSCGKVWR